jgi:hypothetical protein
MNSSFQVMTYSKQRYSARLRKEWRAIVLAFTCSLSLAIGAISCSGGGINLFDIGTDAQLGKQMDDQIRQNPKEYPIMNNLAVKQYIQGMISWNLSLSGRNYPRR